jgi:hypothetical protein
MAPVMSFDSPPLVANSVAVGEPDPSAPAVWQNMQPTTQSTDPNGLNYWPAWKTKLGEVQSAIMSPLQSAGRSIGQKVAGPAGVAFGPWFPFVVFLALGLGIYAICRKGKLFGRKASTLKIAS